jgi:hypothetical protein
VATAAQQAQAEQRRRAAAAAVAGGALVVAPEAGAEVPAAPARAAAGAILAGLVAFLAAQRSRRDAWLAQAMRKRAPAVTLDDISSVIAGEEQRQAAFELKQAQRLAQDLTTALAIPDRAAREAAVRGLMTREQRFARQRDEAMAARAFAAVDRVVLRQQSPTGAFWKLDPSVIEHTAGCLIMGGKFWPWQVLDRVHPPRHAGCPCRLVGYGDAITDGLLNPGAVMDAQTAIRRAAGVVMEGVLLVEPEDAEALIEAAGGRELMETRCALIREGLVADESALDRLLSEARA